MWCYMDESLPGHEVKGVCVKFCPQSVALHDFQLPVHERLGVRVRVAPQSVTASYSTQLTAFLHTNDLLVRVRFSGQSVSSFFFTQSYFSCTPSCGSPCTPW